MAQDLRGRIATASLAACNVGSSGTELFHLVGDRPHEMEAAWRLVESGAIVLTPIENAELPDIHALMTRYADRPMDFADATLVHLAKREGLSSIFTVDQADFDTYRIEGCRRFRVVPVAPPEKRGPAT